MVVPFFEVQMMAEISLAPGSGGVPEMKIYLTVASST